MDTKDKKRRPATGKNRTATAPKRKKQIKKPQVQVVYTQPKPFNRNRFLLRLVTVVAVVLALIFGMSIFFKVENIVVSGAEKYTAWQIFEASGIQKGDDLLGVSAPKVSGRLTIQLPYIKQARVGIQLPDTVNIEIQELDVVYAVEGQNAMWWLIDADGKLVEEISSAKAKEYTQILGVQIVSGEVGSTAQASEPEPETQESTQASDGEDQAEPTVAAPVTVKASERLSTVITILQYLEDNGVIGDAASIDVSDIGNIELWYGERYQVLLGDTTQLGYKIEAMKKSIDQSSEYQSGVLDVSFTIWPDKVGYTPF